MTRIREIGVTVHVRETMAGAVLLAHCIGLVRKGFVVPLGASTPVTTLGYVRAAVELQDQIDRGMLPRPRNIILPFATGGSVAGLFVGLTLTGSPIRITAVQTVEGVIAGRRGLERLIRKTFRLLGVSVPLRGIGRSSVGEEPKDRLRTVQIDRRYLGRGYGDVPSGVKDALSVAARQGLALEPVHSGKAFAALLADLPRFPDDEFLFWNTHHQESTTDSEECVR